MKKLVLLAIALAFLGCDKDNDATAPDVENRDFRQDMRNFVIGISQKAKSIKPGFAVIPQNGIELVTVNGEADGSPSQDYLNAIDGNGQEDLFYGYDNDDQATPTGVSNYLKGFLNVSKSNRKTILVTDYCSTPSKASNSYQVNAANGYISYAAPKRDLTAIPATAPNNSNDAVIANLSQAKNFLYLINSENFTSKLAFINAVKSTNYDVIIMDLFFNEEQFTAVEINQLRNKANGGKRMVICYMSIGESENYRYYWQPSWNTSKPVWMATENPDWPGNFKVKYWNEDWQKIIYKNDNSYLNKIIDANFDGVYLDIIDAFEYFER